MNKRGRKRIVISLGGSLVVPEEGIATEFLISFNSYIRKKLQQDPSFQFFIVVGGGSTARAYRDAGRQVVGHELPTDDLDWLGVHATRLNAHLIRTIFKDIAHPVILQNYDIIQKATESVVIASGWKPGWSTDYCAVLVCENYDVDTVINLSNIEKVYDKDPRKDNGAKPIDSIQWRDFRLIVGDSWVPGMHVPFDPIAAKVSEEMGLTVKILKGGDFQNLDRAIAGSSFSGTLITPSIP